MQKCGSPFDCAPTFAEASEGKQDRFFSQARFLHYGRNDNEMDSCPPIGDADKFRGNGKLRQSTINKVESKIMMKVSCLCFIILFSFVFKIIFSLWIFVYV